MTTGVELIAQERREQIEKHGFDLNKDRNFYHQYELRRAAMWAITFDEDYYPENWGTWFRKKMNDKRSRLTAKQLEVERLKIAGALIAAELDRISKNEP